MIDLDEIFVKHGLICGRMIYGSKSFARSKFPGDLLVFNANIVIKSAGKVWFGDLNITKESKKLKDVAAEINETLYVLRESDCRFGTEEDPVEVLINRAVWDTTKE